MEQSGSAVLSNIYLSLVRQEPNHHPMKIPFAYVTENNFLFWLNLNYFQNKHEQV